MQTKLTLRLDKKLIQKAKEHSSHKGKSISQLVAEYFALLSQNYNTNNIELMPVTRSLKGYLRNKKADVKDYHKHLEDKYL